MKKNYVQLIIAILFATNVMAQNVPNYVPTNGLVGWWPFNGNANDESGNGNHGTVNGATLTSDRFGQTNNAYSFDGLTNYIKISNSSLAAFGQQSFSAVTWFKTNSTSTTNLNDAGMFIRYDNCISNSGWGLGFLGKYKVGGLEFPANRTINQITSTNSYNNNQWHQVILIRNINLMTDLLYIDGTLIGQLKFTSINNLINTNSDLRFGSCGGFQLLSGLLDDIAIYNRALTQEEITALYSAKSCTDPIASITPQSTTTFCQGGSVNLNASTGANYTYEWYNNGNIINGATSSIYNASTSGNYTVKVIDGACNSTSSATTVSVNQYPSSIVQTSGNTTFCQGNSITLSAQGNGSYLWSTGATSKSITVNQTGDYSLTITSNGCSSTSNNTAITVNPLPTASIIPQGNTTFCQGGFVNLVANGGTSYQWNTGSSATSISVNQSGTFTVNVFNSFGCQASANQTVTVNANPSVSLNSLSAYTIKTSSPIQLVGNPTGGSYGGEGVIGSSFNPATLKLGKKTITYNYTSPQGCSGSASKTTIVADTVGNVCSVTKYDTVKVINTITKYDTITTKITINDTVSILKIHFQLTTGIKANTVTNITVYPNPTSDVLIIDAIDSPALAGYMYRILDIQGKQIYNAPVTSSKTEIALKTLGAKGVYVLHIVDANGISIENKKIVLQ